MLLPMDTDTGSAEGKAGTKRSCKLDIGTRAPLAGGFDLRKPGCSPVCASGTKESILNGPPQQLGLAHHGLPFTAGAIGPLPSIGSPRSFSEDLPSSATQGRAALRLECVGNKPLPPQCLSCPPARAIERGWSALRGIVQHAASAYFDRAAVLHVPTNRPADDSNADKTHSITGANGKQSADRGLIVAMEISNELYGFCQEAGNDGDRHAAAPKKNRRRTSSCMGAPPAKFRGERPVCCDITPSQQGDGPSACGRALMGNVLATWGRAGTNPVLVPRDTPTDPPCRRAVQTPTVLRAPGPSRLIPTPNKQGRAISLERRNRGENYFEAKLHQRTDADKPQRAGHQHGAQQLIRSNVEMMTTIVILGCIAGLALMIAAIW